MPSAIPMSLPLGLPCCSLSGVRASGLSGSSLGTSTLKSGFWGLGSGVTGLAGSARSSIAEPLGRGGGGGGGGL